MSLFSIIYHSVIPLSGPGDSETMDGRRHQSEERKAGLYKDFFRRRIILPDPIQCDELKLSFTSIGCPELGVCIDFGPSRRLSYLITRYPELAEYRALLEGSPANGSWNGRHFLMAQSMGQTQRTLWLRQNEVGIDLTESELNGLRELFQKAWAIPELQRWLRGLHEENGEQ